MALVITMNSPESHAKAVAAARIYLRECGFKLLGHAVPYADFVGIDDDGNRLIFVGSMDDSDLLDDIESCLSRCPLEVVACDVLEVSFSDDETATIEHFTDVLAGDGND